MEKKKVDCVVIGGGPGGYPAAIRLAQGGKKVLLIEAKEIGGTCLNRGCIPTKAYLSDAETYRQVKQAGEKGISVGEVHFDWKVIKEKKDAVVKRLRSSLTSVITSYGIEIVKGYASFLSPKVVQVTVKNEKVAEIEADQFIIATGSESKEITSFPFDGVAIHSSTTLLDVEQVPQSLLIVGGGVIGCEFASLFRTFGTEITIVEALDRILPFECPNVSKAMTKAFMDQGIQIKTSTSLKAVTKVGSSIRAECADGTVIEASCALVSIGRVMNSAAIGVDRAGVAVDKGVIVVDDRMRTTVSHIYAIGDVVGKGLYAHLATHQGLVAAENILGHDAHIRYDAVPGVAFSHPQVGSVGLSLDAAKAKGFEASLTSYPMQGLGKAQAVGKEFGFAQIVIEKKTGRILGAQVVGDEVETLIAEMTMAIANELTIECVAETIHAHPTFSEIWSEAALMAIQKPLHFPKR